MTTLARYALDVELACDEIDACETPEIPNELVTRLTDAQGALADKCDRYIGLLDALSSRIELLKEQKRRIKRAIEVGETLQGRVKDHVKYVLLVSSKDGKKIPMKGTTGSLALHANPPKVEIDFVTTDRQVYRCLDESALQLEQSIAPYVKTVTLLQLDRDKLKADLDAGMQLPWARITRDYHVRMRG